MSFTSLVGALFAWKQTKIVRTKPQHDVVYEQHDKRAVVYEATRKILRDVSDGNISDDDLKNYTRCILDARLLFDEDMDEYLAAIRNRIAGWCLANSSIQREISSEERVEWERIKMGCQNWIAQRNGEFVAKFAPFLNEAAHAF